MSEIVPRDWLLAKLKDISALTKGLTYSSADYSDDKNGLAFLTLKSISKDGGYSPFGLKFYKGEFKEHHTIKIGDVLFANTDLTRGGDVVGSPLFFDGFNTNRTTLYSMDLSKLAVDPGKVHSKFLYYSLMTHSVKRYMINSSAGSTVLHLDTNRVKELELKLPSLPEQKIIASILTSVDEVIENTQKKINKLQDLKKATMNELLTKGIGHTEFKDSELGRIPKSWDVVSVLDTNIAIIDGDRGKEYPKEKDFKKSGYCLFLSAKNVTKNGFSFKETTFISKHKEEKLKKGRLSRKDLIITTRGTVGNIAQYGAEIPYDVVRINSGMAIIRNKDERLNSDFLYHILFSEIIIQQIRNLTFGSAQPQLTIGTLNELKLPIPQLSEQLKIVKIVTSIVSNIHHKKQKLAQSQSLKKSLMQDLLTGKVRVKVS